ncbi:phosphotransferase KptA/Tpt1 [Gonapodya prolifera JEL478]|uniref:2'-phosphotransferase n=1 Tax=Gonapodya prolifera (strain JEL478) TaxID=1344416 RepID=A0A139AJH2_GONPJ|nr:phosphotransferase KptA/Tpt1 [Gonapodya prolifera JEL478]|eukprot:KXS16956.1 phosphotransferase KptA/Tpt1 [Gonapodya prolifera JEL478]
MPPKNFKPRASASSSRTHRSAGGQRGGTEGHDVHLSKTLSYILRHGAQKEGLPIRSDGYVKISDLLTRPQLRQFSFEDFVAVVAQNDKKRFMLRREDESGALLHESNDGELVAAEQAKEDQTGPWYIRANQGHSLKVEELKLVPVESADEIPVVIHGTYLRNLPNIVKKGLSKMARTHIHFASGMLGDDGVISGMRKDCDCYIHIATKQAMEDGFIFYRSSNGVILCSGDENGTLPSKYFSKVVDVSGKSVPFERST